MEYYIHFHLSHVRPQATRKVCDDSQVHTLTYIGKLFPAVDPLNLTNISFVAEMDKQSSGDVKERSTASKGMERLDKWMSEITTLDPRKLYIGVRIGGLYLLLLFAIL